jgi:hypothetical protein
MGCNLSSTNVTPQSQTRRRRRPPRLSFLDTGYLPSSESEGTPTPPKKLIAEETWIEKQNPMKCYICLSTTGLLLTMPRCRCTFHAHKLCLMEYVSHVNLRCSICKEYYCLPLQKEKNVEVVQRIMTVIKDREQWTQNKLFIDSIISVT